MLYLLKRLRMPGGLNFELFVPHSNLLIFCLFLVTLYRFHFSLLLISAALHVDLFDTINTGVS